MRSLVALAVILPATASAAPAPTHAATETADLDRNGVTDELRLGWSELEVAMNQGAGPVLHFPIGALRAGTLAADGRWIVVRVETAGGLEGLALEYTGGALHLLWRCPVGPQGVDGDFSVELAATASGVIRHQSRA